MTTSTCSYETAVYTWTYWAYGTSSHYSHWNTGIMYLSPLSCVCCHLRLPQTVPGTYCPHFFLRITFPHVLWLLCSSADCRLFGNGATCHYQNNGRHMLNKYTACTF